MPHTPKLAFWFFYHPTQGDDEDATHKRLATKEKREHFVWKDTVPVR